MLTEQHNIHITNCILLGRRRLGEHWRAPWDRRRQVLRNGAWELKRGSKGTGVVVLVLLPVVAEEGLEEVVLG